MQASMLVTWRRVPRIYACYWFRMSCFINYLFVARNRKKITKYKAVIAIKAKSAAWGWLFEGHRIFCKIWQYIMIAWILKNLRILKVRLDWTLITCSFIVNVAYISFCSWSRRLLYFRVFCLACISLCCFCTWNWVPCSDYFLACALKSSSVVRSKVTGFCALLNCMIFCDIVFYCLVSI